MMFHPNSDYYKWNRKELYKALRTRYVICFAAGLCAGVLVWPFVFHYLWAS